MNRWRIRRCNGYHHPWIVSHPSLPCPRGFPTYEAAREYVLHASKEVPIRREIDHLRRLAPRRTA